MRYILMGFRLLIDGEDFGLDVEEVDIPLPMPVTQEYRGGAMDLAVNLPMASLEAMECTFKVSGQNPELLRRMARIGGGLDRVTVRGGVQNEGNGSVSTHVFLVEGRINAASRDRFQRGEKVGMEFKVNGVQYMRYEVDSDIIHEIQAYPPKRIIDGVDQLTSLNQALGF